LKKQTKLEKQERLVQCIILFTIVVCMVIFIGAALWPLVQIIVSSGSHALYQAR